MLTALLYGLGAAVPLLIGAAVGLRWTLPKAGLGALMAFGAGTMIAAVSMELFEPAFRRTGVWISGAALLLGAAFYVVADRLIETRLGPATIGWALLLGAVLDGIPESTALGVSLGPGTGIALLVAIAVGNVPEAIGGAALMRERSQTSTATVLWFWAAITAALVAVTVLGHALSESITGTHVGTVQAFAGGATIAVLADSLMPEAYREGGWWIGMATAAGFLLSFVLAD
ncbi:ZIP family metal transporter [Nocardia higoensis]|uniref:ZIP family metal transporter n=1 Tax=Nocardia higoensis TaxID=228599 RepID=A0ABS0DG20_9NOCA|nr:ZIP family metal transporter [Nocardia higoensis]MBF6357417.1 ZIP family metal transporter [Nocardia higoensis]